MGRALSNKWFKFVAVVAVILLPVAAYGVYRYSTRFPAEIRIAGGPKAGLYKKLAADICARLNTSLEQRGEEGRGNVFDSAGSLDNFRRLRDGNVDFALYQSGVVDFAHESHAREESIAFVANLYMQPAHLIVRKDLNLQSDQLFQGLRGKRVAMGIPDSGDFAMSQVILTHLGLQEAGRFAVEMPEYDEENYYAAVLDGFDSGTLDAAIMTIGEEADVFQQLVERGKCEILGIPNCTALTSKHVYLKQYTIPAGRYGIGPNAKPATDVETVASSAQLLTRADAPSHLVNAVTRIVLDKDFARENHLKELFEDQDFTFAQQKPEFPVHPGALQVYGPAFDISMFESLDAAYSLAASGILMVFIGYRWTQNRQIRKREHKLDRYIHALLDIEKRQMHLDRSIAATAEEIDKLQDMLDEVTVLRQEALGEFTAHDLEEDRASDCFISMCHALSNKINAKLSRQRIDLMLTQLVSQAQASGGESTGNESKMSSTG